MRSLRFLPVLVALLSLVGCAGGWRGGVVPSKWADGSSAASAPATETPAAKRTGGAATTTGTTFTWSGEGASVALAGDFNEWSTSADPMAKQTDGGWKLVKALAPGRYGYKFVIDGTTWKPDPNAVEKADDGFGGSNSIIVVGGGTAAAPAKPTLATQPAAAKPGQVVSADGVSLRWQGGGNTVHLAGDFNSWSPSAEPMAKQADGSFLLTRKFEPGRYAYKFVVNGTDWKADPTATETVDDGFGGTNSILVVGAAGSATSAPLKVATTSTPAAAVKVSGSARPPIVAANGVTFTYAGIARSVSLCGGFNQWAPIADAMQQQPDGTWTLVKKLPAGRHAYKFLIDGSKWAIDPANPDSEDDGFGGKSSILIVK